MAVVVVAVAFLLSIGGARAARFVRQSGGEGRDGGESVMFLFFFFFFFFFFFLVVVVLWLWLWLLLPKALNPSLETQSSQTLAWKTKASKP